MTTASTQANRPGVAIIGTGMAIPQRTLTSQELEGMVATSDEWIVQRTGIQQRHVCADDQRLADLAADAVNQALSRTDLAPTDLDQLICASTMSPDMVCPATACQIVERIGAVPCGAMDLNLACSGFVAALNVAANTIVAGGAKTIAVVGAEKLSRIVNWKDRNTCVLFGDGAGAAILQAAEPGRGCLYQNLGSDGRGWKELFVPRSASDLPDNDVFNGCYDTLQMNGREVFKFAVTTLQRSVEQAMAACGLKPDDVKIVVPHQSNVRILNNAREKLGLSEDKLYVNLPRYGNTSAASVAICLNELCEADRLKRDDIVIFTALGGGLTWSTSVWRM